MGDQMASMDAKLSADVNMTLHDVTADDDHSSSEAWVARQQVADKLRRIIQKLSPDQQRVLNGRELKDDGVELSFDKLGETLGTSRQWANTLHKKALETIRQVLTDASISGDALDL